MTRATIQAFVVREFFGGHPPKNLAGQVRLVSTGIIDSVGTMRLVLFLEEKFGIVIGPQDIGSGALDTLDSMTSLVDRLVASRGATPA